MTVLLLRPGQSSRDREHERDEDEKVGGGGGGGSGSVRCRRCSGLVHHASLAVLVSLASKAKSLCCWTEHPVATSLAAARLAARIPPGDYLVILVVPHERR